MQKTFCNSTLEQAAKMAVSLGYRVFVMNWIGNVYPYRYFHFAKDGGSIGYCESHPWTGCVKFSTLHMPSQKYGSAIACQEEDKWGHIKAEQLTPKHFEEAVSYAPAWYRRHYPKRMGKLEKISLERWLEIKKENKINVEEYLPD